MKGKLDETPFQKKKSNEAMVLLKFILGLKLCKTAVSRVVPLTGNDIGAQ